MNSVGTGTRVLSFVTDTILVFILTFAVSRTWTWYVFYYQIKYFPFFYFWFAVTFLYYLFFEGIWRRTPGKWLSLSKVVSADGSKASFGQIVIRSFIRTIGIILIDSVFLPFTGRTAHDYVSKTYVIEV